MDVRLICGIDGGQTSTRCVLATTESELLGRGTGGPLIHLSAYGAHDRFLASLGQALQEAWTAAGITQRPLAAIVLGATGVVAGSPEASAAAELLSALVQADVVHVCSDSMIALQGAHAGRPGVIVITGTGTIAFGMDSSGRTARAAGWGWLIGDEGSAFAIGRAGLRAACHAHDGTGPATSLSELVVQHFGIVNLHDVKRIISAPDFGAKGFAALAAVVSQAAERGDAVAIEIIREAGLALAQQTAAVVGKLDFGAEPVPVAPLGGAFNHVFGLKQAFVSAMETTSVSAVVTPPRLPAVLGAVLMALELCNADIVSALLRLQHTTAVQSVSC
jgi:glucosamine kinase